MDKYVITKFEIDKMEGEYKQHYLNSDAERINKSLGDLTGITGLGFHIIEVRPNKESTEYHAHKYEDECIYILYGQAEVTIGDEVFHVKEGDFVGYRAGGSAHKMRNIGSSLLKCIVVGERLNHDVADYPRLNKRLYRNIGQPWELVDINNVSNPSAGNKA